MHSFAKDFPILRRQLNNQRLAYLDNAATTQKPQVVIDALADYYTRYNANVHRGLHTLSQEATEAMDAARRKIAALIGAQSEKDIVFTSGTTMSINHVAYAWAEHNLHDGDEILLSQMEHHANTVPWLELAMRKKVNPVFVPVLDTFELDYTAMEKLVSKKTKLISLAHISNVLGTENDIPRIVAIAHSVGARVMIDAAQSIARKKISAADCDVDFLAASGHKMYGPTGTGFLYIKPGVEKEMRPFISGGGMILEVTEKSVTYQDPPEGFEAGTPNIADNIALGVAADYLMQHDVSQFEKIEQELTRYAHEKLSAIGGLRRYYHEQSNGILSFTLDYAHPHDIAEILNRRGVAIRSGNHCAMPLHRRFGIPATARISLACYNTRDDIDAAVDGLREVQKLFA